jgi:predicted nuclease of predicted toxin-antitoxin system
VILWIDAQLSPALAPWITQQFGIEVYSVKWLGYRDATDPIIFQAAREAGAVVMTKDSDFLRLLEQYGPPPQVLWVTLGNTSNARMREVLSRVLLQAVALLESGESLVEISDARSNSA